MSLHNEETTKSRRQLALLLFVGNSIIYSLRVNLSVAIVAMVGQRSMEPKETKVVDLTDTCPIPPNPILTKSIKQGYSHFGEFDWEEHVQGTVLGSFFWGYCLTNLIGGRLAEKFGGKVVYGTGILLTALLTLISPFAARYSTNAFIAVRVLEGMSEGVTFPSTNVLMSNWVPTESKASFLSFALSGCQFGNVITLSLSGAICESSYGWPYVFYTCGAVALVFCLVWFEVVTDFPPGTPAKITERKQLPVPWSEIFTSGPFLCVIVAHFASNWGFYCLLTEMPSYLAHILHFDVHTNGMVSSLPYLGKWIFMIVYSTWLDKSVSNGKFSLRTARRMSSFIGLVIPGLFLAAIQLAGCHWQSVIFLLVAALTISGADHSGFLCAFQELGPNFAGTLTGISNSVATMPGFLAPQFTGYLTTGSQTLSAWRVVFLTATIIYLLGASVYLLYMSADTQTWNSPNNKHKKRSFNDKSNGVHLI